MCGNLDTSAAVVVGTLALAFKKRNGRARFKRFQGLGSGKHNSVFKVYLRVELHVGYWPRIPRARRRR